jgi:hypothetical protein
MLNILFRIIKKTGMYKFKGNQMLAATSPERKILYMGHSVPNLLHVTDSPAPHHHGAESLLTGSSYLSPSCIQFYYVKRKV